MKNEFSTLDIVKALDIPRERLREWMNRGYIEPSIQKASGQGTKALFSRADIYLVALFKKLIGLGFSRKSASDFVKLYPSLESAFPGKPDPFILIRYEIIHVDDPRLSMSVKIQLRALGRERTEMIGMASSSNTINLKTGTFSETVRRPKNKIPFDEILERDYGIKKNDDPSWEYLLVINFEKIKREVDTALSE